MLRLIEDVLKSETHTECKLETVTVWVPSKPCGAPLADRAKDAWAVLTGKAEAVVWPEPENTDD